eukprot:6204561-Pleurochrysis_carterae.AAC.1
MTEWRRDPVWSTGTASVDATSAASSSSILPAGVAPSVAAAGSSAPSPLRAASSDAASCVGVSSIGAAPTASAARGPGRQ